MPETVFGRDENAARVMLNWALSASGREPACGGGPQKRPRRGTKLHLELLLRRRKKITAPSQQGVIT